MYVLQQIVADRERVYLSRRHTKYDSLLWKPPARTLPELGKCPSKLQAGRPWYCLLIRLLTKFHVMHFDYFLHLHGIADENDGDANGNKPNDNGLIYNDDGDDADDAYFTE